MEGIKNSSSPKAKYHPPICFLCILGLILFLSWVQKLMYYIIRGKILPYRNLISYHARGFCRYWKYFTVS